MASKVPWEIPTPQEYGRQFEKAQAKKIGARPHVASGALGDKNDYSTPETVYEQKTTNKTHTIKGDDLNKLLQNALRQGKDAVYTIYFRDADVTIEGVVRRGT
jgi:hypothetical protein